MDPREVQASLDREALATAILLEQGIVRAKTLDAMGATICVVAQVYKSVARHPGALGTLARAKINETQRDRDMSARLDRRTQ